jgi:hypothetical protein
MRRILMKNEIQRAARHCPNLSWIRVVKTYPCFPEMFGRAIPPPERLERMTRITALVQQDQQNAVHSMSSESMDLPANIQYEVMLL